MCAAYGLIETHLGLKTSESAKAQAAERFISLHYKLLSYQVPLERQQRHQETQPDAVAQQLSPAHNDTSVSYLFRASVDIKSFQTDVLTYHSVLECIHKQHTGADDAIWLCIFSALDDADNRSRSAINTEP